MPTSSTTELLPMDATEAAGIAGGPGPRPGAADGPAAAPVPPTPASIVSAPSAPDSSALPPPAPWGEPVPGAPPGPSWLRAPGLTPYPASLSAMAARAAAVRAGTAGELVWLVEHPPLYTAGTSARPDDLADPGRFPTFDAGRGGQWTYHGPGQRTGYVVLDLQRPHGPVPARDVRCYVHALEGWLIGALRRLGVRGERREGRVGIWVAHDGGESKIGAIGVRVTRWVSWHGVALNVHPALDHFGGIVPCGIREHGVTSLAALGVGASMADADAALLAAWGEAFG